MQRACCRKRNWHGRKMLLERWCGWFFDRGCSCVARSPDTADECAKKRGSRQSHDPGLLYSRPVRLSLLYVEGQVNGGAERRELCTVRCYRTGHYLRKPAPCRHEYRSQSLSYSRHNPFSGNDFFVKGSVAERYKTLVGQVHHREQDSVRPVTL